MPKPEKINKMNALETNKLLGTQWLVTSKQNIPSGNEAIRPLLGTKQGKVTISPLLGTKQGLVKGPVILKTNK